MNVRGGGSGRQLDQGPLLWQVEGRPVAGGRQRRGLSFEGEGADLGVSGSGRGAAHPQLLWVIQSRDVHRSERHAHHRW